LPQGTIPSPEVTRRRLLSALGPARFVQFAEIDATADGEEGFHYVSLYLHRIGNQFRVIDGEAFIISNGFLSSHAYNLALVHLFHAGGDPAGRTAALKHNYKKFFAECVLGVRNCLMGRALLLETILFEQDLMKPLFASLEDNPGRSAAASEVATTMSMLLSQHELGHYQDRRSGGRLRADAADAFGGRLEAMVARTEQAHGPEPATELLCDGVAAWLSLTADSEAPAEDERLVRLRMIALGFLCFADLTALQKSADLTARASRGEDAGIRLGSEIRSKEAFGYTIVRDPAMDLRARAVVDLCEAEARSRGAELFGEDGRFPLPRSIAADLAAAFRTFAEEAPGPISGLTGTDLQRRQLVQLVAESLHGHEAGAEHLLWRSKQFSVGGQAVDP
jgi:hypothetical protein